jgi:hydroxymethylbilane synthase
MTSLVSKHPGGFSGAAGQRDLSPTAACGGKHQLSWKRPDLNIVDLRGNVPTRLRKLAENDWEGGRACPVPDS